MLGWLLLVDVNFTQLSDHDATQFNYGTISHFNDKIKSQPLKMSTGSGSSVGFWKHSTNTNHNTQRE